MSTFAPPARLVERMTHRLPGWVAANHAVLPVVAAIVLLVAATWLDGGFAIRHWAPVALLGLAALAAWSLSGPATALSGPLRLSIVAIWALVLWTALSMFWSGSPARAWEDAGRTALYAALATLPLCLGLTRREIESAMRMLLVGVAALSVATLAVLYTDPAGWFVGGRLERPVGHASATAALFALGFWPLIAVAAARERRPVPRALGLAAACLGLGLAFLAQSRGVALGLGAGGLVAIGLGPDRVRRAWLALLAAAAVGAASQWLLAPWDGSGSPGGITREDVTTAAVALTAIMTAAFGTGLGIALADSRLGRARSTIRHAALVALVLASAAATAAGAFAVGDPVDFARDRVNEFRSLESDTSSGSRLDSVGGQRQDLWRVAWDEFRSQPLTGAGAGSYAFAYFEDRRTERNTSDPHSLPMKLLAETGAVGVLLFGAVLAGLLLAALRGWRAAPPGDRRLATGLAAGGAVVLGHSLIEWLWLIPGVMGLGITCLALAATLLAPRPEIRAGVPAAVRRLRFGAAAGLVAAAAAVFLLLAADLELRQARAAGRSSPAAQLTETRQAGRLNPWSVRAHYLQASALESLGRLGEARSELREALELEPRNFATVALLGDLETRAGNPAAARAHYRRALALNPLDTGLKQLSGEH